MSFLSSALDICAPLLREPLIYIDYPVHGNVGDLLIWMGAIEFLKRHKKIPIARYSIDNFRGRARNRLENCSTLCFHGGGNFGDLWPHHQKLREEIIQSFLHKRIVIFPQSVHFQEIKELDRVCKIIREHPDLHIFLRDKNSFSLLYDRGVPNCVLCPDMAHSLWGKLVAPAMDSIPSPLYVLRRDKETSWLPEYIRAHQAESVDWDVVLTGLTRRVFQIGTRIHSLDGRIGNLLPAYSIWLAVSRLLIRRAVKLFARYDTVITNRLHAMILSALLDRKAVVYDNCYGKISSYYDLWMSTAPNFDCIKQPAP